MDLRTQWGKVSAGRTEESSTDICTFSCIKQPLGSAIYHREPRLTLWWPRRMGGGRGERLKNKGIYRWLRLICTAVQRKSAQHCKAVFHQLKKKRKKEPLYTWQIPLKSKNLTWICWNQGNNRYSTASDISVISCPLQVTDPSVKTDNRTFSASKC